MSTSNAGASYRSYGVSVENAGWCTSVVGLLTIFLVIAWGSLPPSAAAQEGTADDLFEPYVSERLSADSVQVLWSCVRGEQAPPEECPTRKNAYRVITGQIGFADDPDLGEALASEIARVRLILPDDLQSRIDSVLEEGVRDTALGEDILFWWRSNNQLPATRINERMEEHLRRVDHALEEYADDRYPTGVDARGEMYIRFGPPRYTTSVNFTDTRLTGGAFRESSVLASARYPRHEYWSYPHLGRLQKYLFVEKRGEYVIGEVNDLVPSTARTGLGNTTRGHQKARGLSALLHVIYGNLSVLNIHFGDMQQKLDRAYGPIADPSTSGPMQLLNVFHQGRADENQRDRERDREAPRQHPGRSSVDNLPITARTARFLADDGTTRTEVYWTVPYAALEEYEEDDSPPAFLLSTVASQQRPDYRQWQSSRNQVLLLNEEGEHGILPPQTHVARGNTGLFHVRLQWDGYRAQLRPGTGEFRNVGKHLNRHVLRLDSLTALDASGDELLLSDIRPITLHEDDSPIPGEAPPYPFREILPDLPLGLYFEVYNLTFDDDDQTRYLVEYEIKREEPRRGFAGIFGGSRQVVTSTSSEHRGATRKTEEQVLLDLEEWTEEGEMDVVVRVTDRVTGQQAERAVSFRMINEARNALED